MTERISKEDEAKIEASFDYIRYCENLAVLQAKRVVDFQSKISEYEKHFESMTYGSPPLTITRRALENNRVELLWEKTGYENYTVIGYASEHLPGTHEQARKGRLIVSDSHAATGRYVLHGSPGSEHALAFWMEGMGPEPGKWFPQQISLRTALVQFLVPITPVQTNQILDALKEVEKRIKAFRKKYIDKADIKMEKSIKLAKKKNEREAYLTSQLSAGEISQDDFEKLIDQNNNDYLDEP